MKQDINKLMEEARVAVKQASHKIADAHAEASVDKHPAREAIGHLRDLQEALYGLALYAAAQVRTHTESLSQVMERTQAKKCFVVPLAERLAQEDMDVSPGSVRRAILKEHFQALPDTLSAPKSPMKMTLGDRMVEGTLRRQQALHPDYELVWDAPPGQPDWQPVVGTLYSLSNGNIAYLFDAGPDKRNLERSAEKRTLAMVNKFGKATKKKPAAEKQLLVVHKTCPSWGETQCGTSLYTSCPSVTSTFYWKGVTCKECLKLRGQQHKDAALKKRIAQHLPAHKTCPSWAETHCGKPLLTGNDPVTVFDWKRTTCKECLKLRGVKMPRDKGIKQAVRAAKRKFLGKAPDTGDLHHRWHDPQPNHPNRFYLVVNGATKKNPKGNGYYTIEQARRLQKKLLVRGMKVTVGETYLRR